MSRLIKLLKNTIKVYEEQGSSTRAFNYAAKYVARRSPVIVSRVFGRRSATSTRPADRSTSVALAILASGGVGDLIVMARYLRDLHKTVGPFSFDLYSPHPAISEWVFRNVPGVRSHHVDIDFSKAAADYDASLFLSSFAQVKHNRLLGTADGSERDQLNKVLQAIERFNLGIQNCIDQHPLMDGVLGQKLQFQNITRTTSFHSMSGTPYGGHDLQLPGNPEVLSKFGLNDCAYVTVHNGFEVSNITSGRCSTKCYPHFDEVVSVLRRRFPELVFVQLGSKTSTPIPSVDLDLISRTTLEDASTILGNAVCHLDNESGLVHIASCHGTRCCVVFGPTPQDYFGYEENTNVRPPVCGSCWWATENWMDRCPRGFDAPPCTHSQKPGTVAEMAVRLITESLGSRSDVRLFQLERS